MRARAAEYVFFFSAVRFSFENCTFTAKYKSDGVEKGYDGLRE